MPSIYAAIDPGSRAGVVGVRFRHGDGNWATAEIVDAHTVYRPSDPVEWEADLQFMERIYHALWTIQPEVIVIEEAVDAAGHWNAQGQKGQRRGTAFRAGVGYMAALVAAKQCERRILPDPKRFSVVIVTYPVGNYGGRVGWMQNGRAKHKREDVLRDARYLVRALDHKPAVTSWTDHTLMALGLLRFHIQREGLVKRLAQLPGVK